MLNLTDVSSYTWAVFNRAATLELFQKIASNMHTKNDMQYC